MRNFPVWAVWAVPLLLSGCLLGVIVAVLVLGNRVEERIVVDASEPRATELDEKEPQDPSASPGDDSDTAAGDDSGNSEDDDADDADDRDDSDSDADAEDNESAERLQDRSDARIAELLDAIDRAAERQAADDSANSAGAAANTGNSRDAAAPSNTATSTTTGNSVYVSPADEGYATVGKGITVRMGRANWSTGYVQAEIYKQILERAGYAVTSPSRWELAPALAYIAMADRDIDFWANSWYPGHHTWLATQLPDGSLVRHHVTVFEEGPLPRQGLQGFLITKSVAEDYGITSLQQINDSPALIKLFDADGNGKAEILGCPESWTCDDITESMIAFHGWDNIEQTKAGYDAMIAQANDLVRLGEPVIIYTWQPSSYVAQLRPGDNVLWLTTHPTDVLDGSNPLGLEGGEGWGQDSGFSGLGAGFCTQPCQLGWEASDILVTANSDFVAENPFLDELLRLVVLNVIDISRAILAYDNSNRTENDVDRIAGDWMDAHASTVDGWLQAAYDASS